MSSWLIVFDRSKGSLLSIDRLEDWHEADEARLRLELAHRRDEGIEIVVLEANSEEQLRATHARYFGSAGLEDLAKAVNS